jgi:tetratricopeptide (TPR) repeat protein
MTIKYFILVFCSLILVSCTSIIQSKKTTEYSNQYNEKKVNQGSAEQNIKLKDAPAYFDRATLKHTKLNDFKGALNDYNQAISLNPKYSAAYSNRANLKNDELNDTKGALTDLSQAISLNPKLPEAYFSRANLKDEKLNDRAGSIQDYRQAARLYQEQGDTEGWQNTIDRLKGIGATE